MLHLVLKFLMAWNIRLSLGKYRQNVVLEWRKYMSQLAVICCISALDIGLSNLAIEFVTISLYTITKITSTPFMLLCALLFNLERKYWGLISKVFIIFFRSFSIFVRSFVYILGQKNLKEI
uniref:Solute carrier family 35 member C2 n=1 Tax=Lepeophtheirus salmonis TaxID=72036 RepID=D3PG76_LEPSM|nr:Solute carrier family 35 member C2 [Lepeophtheirus salmonis]